MNEIITITQQTMSSLEIAKLTEKNHADVLRDIRKIFDEAEIDQSKYASIFLDSYNREQPCFNLPRRECDLIVSGYSVKYRLAIIDRWHELEANESKPEIPQTQGQFLVMIAQSFAEQERKLLELSAAHSETKAATERNERRLDQLETASDHFTVLGYHLYLHKERLTLPEAAKIGAVASKYCKQHEVPMGEVPDPRFGRVKTYPRWVLDEITKTIQ
jgi:phage regulator Rha-like protein